GKNNDRDNTNLESTLINFFFSQIIDQHTYPIYSCDPEGNIIQFNKAAATLWEDSPEIGKVKWGNSKMFYPDGRPMRPEDSPMAQALQKQKTIEQEIIIE